MRNVSEIVRRAVFGQESGEVFAPLVTITHSSLAESIRIVGDTVDLVKDTYTYTALPFSFDLPSDQEGRLQSIQMRISNISRDLVQLIRSISVAPDVKFEIVRVSDPTDVVAGPWEMTLSKVSYNAVTIEGEIGRKQRLNIDFPKSDYTYIPKHFPGLF